MHRAASAGANKVSIAGWMTKAAGDARGTETASRSREAQIDTTFGFNGTVARQQRNIGNGSWNRSSAGTPKQNGRAKARPSALEQMRRVLSVHAVEELAVAL